MKGLRLRQAECDREASRRLASPSSPAREPCGSPVTAAQDAATESRVKEQFSQRFFLESYFQLALKASVLVTSRVTLLRSESGSVLKNSKIRLCLAAIKSSRVHKA